MEWEIKSQKNGNSNENGCKDMELNVNGCVRWM